MNGAAALLLPLPETERSICRFPTKLGHYLSSATPVVATSVGDLTHYLENGKSACLVPPNDMNKFADSVAFLLRNTRHAKAIGMAGREVAMRHFSLLANKSKLVRFFMEIAR
jgi:glycosyltransferase involved in cell wall biosynthesis